MPVLFLIPAEAGEKLGLGVTILLALSVFLLTLGEVTPITSDDIPLLSESGSQGEERFSGVQTHPALSKLYQPHLIFLNDNIWK